MIPFNFRFDAGFLEQPLKHFRGNILKYSLRVLRSQRLEPYCTNCEFLQVVCVSIT